MFVSAEIRWFWPDSPPPEFKQWFLSSAAHPYAAGGGAWPPRRDVYLYDPEQTELGIKARGVKAGLEVKGLVTSLPDVVLDGPFRATAELWTKWDSKVLTLDRAPTVVTNKTRWLRKFDTTGPTPREVEVGPDEEPVRGGRPAVGCNVELTQLEVGGKTVWTFGFEAFGPVSSVGAQLRAVTSLLASRNPPALSDAKAASYPAWLKTQAPDAPKLSTADGGVTDELKTHLTEKVSSIPPLRQILERGVGVDELVQMIAKNDLTSLLRHYVKFGQSAYDPDQKGTANQIADENWDSSYSELRKDLQLLTSRR